VERLENTEGVNHYRSGVIVWTFASVAVPGIKQVESTFRSQIQAIARLPKGWDSYDAKAPSKIACEHALTLLENLEAEGIKPTRIAPTSDESVLVRFATDSKLFECDFYSDGAIGVSVVQQGYEKQYFDVSHLELDSFFRAITESYDAVI
jgi:hypothetical protein